MKKTLFVLFLSVLFGTPVTISVAQDSPPSGESPQSKTDPKPAAEDSPQDPQADDQKADDQKADDQKADDPKADDQKADDQKADDPKADDQKADDKKADDKKADDKKADEKKADDKKADDKKADEKQADEGKSDSDSKDEKTTDARESSSPPRALFGVGTAEELAYSKRAGEFVAVFKPLIASAEASTVKVMSGKRQLALGVVVDSDGLILTKASELRGELTCSFPDGRIATATVFGVHTESDLAMLKIDLKGLNPIQWSTEPSPLVGHWLVTPNLQKSTLDVGIVGVNERVIPPSDPFIGIQPAPPAEDAVDRVPGAAINSVVAGSPAEDADLMVGDVITRIDDIEIVDWPGLQKTLKQYDANDRITLTLKRAGKDLKIKLTLAERDKIAPQNDRSNQQNSMGSVLSRRRKDFPSAFQHDCMLNSSTCGGPVIDLNGQVVGINIARAGRVDSLALPVQTILPVVALLKTGELSPALVNEARVAEIGIELAELAEKMGGLPSKKSALETKYLVEKAKKEELERILKDVQDRLKVIDLKSNNFGTELDSVKNELKAGEKTRQRLEADRKLLSTGVR